MELEKKKVNLTLFCPLQHYSGEKMVSTTQTLHNNNLDPKCLYLYIKKIKKLS